MAQWGRENEGESGNGQKEAGGGWSGFATAGSVAAQERGDLVAIAANSHGAPATAMGARVVIEEEAACRIGANADRRIGPFDDQFGSGTGNGGEKPLEAAFPGNEFEPPAFGAGNKLVVPFGETKQIVDGLDPALGEGLLLHEGREDGADGFAQTKDFQENGVHGLRFGVEQRRKAGCAFGGDDAGIHEEGNKLVPGEIMRGGSGIGEIKGKAAGDEAGWEVCGCHRKPRRQVDRVTGVVSHAGYSMSGVICGARLETCWGLAC